MFNFLEIFDKLKGLKDRFSEMKTQMEKSTIEQSSTDGKINLTISEWATIKDIQINEDLLQDKEQLEDQLVVTLNAALEKVKQNMENEVKKTAKENLPDIPGLPF